MATSEMQRAINDIVRLSALIAMEYKRCEHCHELIDPVEEYHVHEVDGEEKRFYGRPSGLGF